MSKTIEFPQSVELKKEPTLDECKLINGLWQTTMKEMIESINMDNYVESIEKAKDYAKVWLGLTPSYKLSWLLDTREMEQMLKKVFKIKE